MWDDAAVCILVVILCAVFLAVVCWYRVGWVESELKWATCESTFTKEYTRRSTCESELEKATTANGKLDHDHWSCNEKVRVQDTEVAEKLRQKDQEVAERLAQKDGEIAETVRQKDQTLADQLKLKDAETAEKLKRKHAQVVEQLAQKDTELASELKRKDLELADKFRQKEQEVAEEFKRKDAELAEKMADHRKAMFNEAASTVHDLREEVALHKRTIAALQGDATDWAAEEQTRITEVQDLKHTIQRLNAELVRQAREAETKLAKQLTEWTKQEGQLLDDERSWDKYDAVLDPHGLSLDRMAWPIYNTTPDWDKYRKAKLVCATGKFNAGKSHVLSRLYGLSLPTGGNMPTMGLSFACVPHPRADGIDECLIDMAGSQMPVGEDDRELGDKLNEDLQRDLCFRMADIAILVVGEMNQNDQDAMKELVVDRTFEDRITKGLNLIVVHNYPHASREESAAERWKRFALAAFPNMKETKRAGSLVPLSGYSEMTSASISTPVRVKHFALANEHSEFGKVHNREVYDSILRYIEDARHEMVEWRLTGRFLNAVNGQNGLIPKKYINMGSFAVDANWTSRPAKAADVEDYAIPPLCRDNSACRRGYGELSKSWVLTLDLPKTEQGGVRATYHQAHKRESARSFVGRVSQSFDTIARDKYCDADGCKLTIVVVGCAPFHAQHTPSSLGVDLNCSVPERKGVDTDMFPALRPGGFDGHIDAKEMLELKHPRYCSCRFQAGVLELYFVEYERLGACTARGLASECKGDGLAEVPGGTWISIAALLASVVAAACFIVFVGRLVGRGRDGARPQPSQAPVEARKMDASPPPINGLEPRINERPPNPPMDEDKNPPMSMDDGLPLNHKPKGQIPGHDAEPAKTKSEPVATPEGPRAGEQQAVTPGGQIAHPVDVNAEQVARQEGQIAHPVDVNAEQVARQEGASAGQEQAVPAEGSGTAGAEKAATEGEASAGKPWSAP